MRQIVIIAHDIRSTYNIGSLIRTAEGMGVAKIYFSGYTPYPAAKGDSRLPHIAKKLDARIHKTALNAENQVPWEHLSDVMCLIKQLKAEDYYVVALEQSKNASLLQSFKPPEKIALLLGREVGGLDASLLEMCDRALEIPMFGQKESYNVIQATAMALYHIRFYPFK